MTMTTAETGTSARETLQAGLCSASCLLSKETDRCGCKCQGAYHGALLAAEVPAAGRERGPVHAEA